MAKFTELMRRWFGGDSAGSETETVDPILVMEQALERCMQQQARETARVEALTEQAELSLQERRVWLFAFDKSTQQQRLGRHGEETLKAVLCQEGESLPEALERCSGMDALEVILGQQQYFLQIKAHSWEDMRIYTVLDVTGSTLLLRQQEEARLRDPLTGLYTKEGFLQKAQTVLQPQTQVCAVHLRTRLRTELMGIGPMGTPEVFLRAWTEAVRNIPCQGLFTRSGKAEISGVLYGYDPQALPAVLEMLRKSLQEKTVLMEPAGVDVHGVILGLARYPEDGRNVEGLLLRARLSAWLADRQDREGCVPYPGDGAVPEHLLRGKAAFRKLVEEKQVGFLLQPIVRTSNAKVEGYALSMVSRSPDLPEMEQVVQTAEFWGDAQALERLLWFQGMDWMKEQIKSGKLMYNTKLWLPTIPGTYLCDRDARRFEEICFDHMPYLVLQLDSQGEDLLCAEVKHRRWDGLTEVRCRGMDRASRMALSLVQPKLVRADASLVEGIASDRKKQEAFKSLKAWAAANGGKLLAEGIGNSADLRTAVMLGADFLQGDCLGRPEASPGDIPGNRIAQIGEAHYGKRG